MSEPALTNTGLLLKATGVLAMTLGPLIRITPFVVVSAKVPVKVRVPGPKRVRKVPPELELMLLASVATPPV